MSFLFANFISGVLQAGVGDTDTSLTLIDASDWPSWGGGVVSRLTLSDGKQPEEIVEVTDRVANTLYVSRGKEGTLPRVWAAGSQIYLALTKESFPEMASGVISVHGRVGTVVGVTGDYNAAQITNNSSVSGATVKDALNTLLASISSSVISVFGRTGAVVAAASDYDASQVDNDSAVVGSKVSDALNTLNTALAAKLNSSAVSAYGLTLIDDVDAAAARTTLGLGALATLSTVDLTSQVTGDLPFANLAQIATSSFLGRVTAGTGDVEVLTVAQAKTLLNLTGTNSGDQTITLTSDVTGSGTGSFATTIANNAVSLAKMADIATASFLGRNTAGTGDPEVLSVATAKTMLNLTGTNSGDQTITLTSDVTGSGTGSFATTIAANAVGLTKLADIATASFLGRVTAGTGDPEVLTGTQATTLLDLFTTSLKGLVPASGGGTTNFLRADGTWAAPPGGGGGSPGGATNTIQYNNAGAFGGVSGLTFVTTNQLDFGPANDGFTLSGLPATVAADTGASLEIFAGTSEDSTTFGASIFFGGSSNAVPGDLFLRAGFVSGGAAGNIIGYTPNSGSQPLFDGDLNLPVDRLDSGNGASSSTYWRGDGVWATPSATTPSVLNLPGQDSLPSTPASGSQNIFERRLVSGSGPGFPGLTVQTENSHVQDLSILNSLNAIVGWWGPVAFNGSSVAAFGLGTVTATGTAASFSSGNTDKSTRIKGVRYNSAAAAGSAAGSRGAGSLFTNWSQANLRFRGAFSLSVNTTGYRAFVGICNSSAVLAGDPSALLNCVGVGFDAADASTGNLQLMHNDGSGVCTKVDLGASFARSAPSGIVYDVEIEFAGGVWNYRVTHLVSGAVASGTLNTNIPAVNTTLTFKCEVQNGAIAAVCGIFLSTISLRYTTE